MKDDIRTLMELYVDGDEEAFNKLYLALRPTILSVLRKHLRENELVEDGYQLTMLKIHQARHRHRRGDSVLPWVTTIARNVAYDLLRRRVTYRKHFMDTAYLDNRPQIDEPVYTWDLHQREERNQAVKHALSRLPSQYRVIIERHKLGGERIGDIAGSLGIKEGAARVRAHRGYKRLARMLSRFRTEFA